MYSRPFRFRTLTQEHPSAADAPSVRALSADPTHSVPLDAYHWLKPWEVSPGLCISGILETSPVSTQTLPTDSLDRRVSTVGRVGPHLEIQIIDEAGAQVPRGTPGELCTRGYSVMAGYWDDPAKTAEAVDADGWMHTGDIAVMDDEGYLSVTGRIKDMVIRGGENIYPREVEEFLYTHPDIVDAQVVGVPDEKYGEELMAWIRVADGAQPPTTDSLRDFCAGRIAHQKIPRYVQVIDEFPMTVTGKVRKVDLRARGEELLGGAG
ncbi:AMP-binding enzyme [Mycolicibacterium hippocampi]|uniref:AMP-binding enzyme n=1 Tax=Mycolicibacterium hippocampi TaxID=659824 RepID=UPI003556729E